MIRIALLALIAALFDVQISDLKGVPLAGREPCKACRR